MAEKKTVTVRLPLLKDQGASDTEFVSVNFNNYLIKRGEDVEVPIEVAEVLKEAQIADDAAFVYATRKAKLREPSREEV